MLAAGRSLSSGLCDRVTTPDSTSPSLVRYARRGDGANPRREHQARRSSAAQHHRPCSQARTGGSDGAGMPAESPVPRAQPPRHACETRNDEAEGRNDGAEECDSAAQDCNHARDDRDPPVEGRGHGCASPRPSARPVRSSTTSSLGLNGVTWVIRAVPAPMRGFRALLGARTATFRLIPHRPRRERARFCVG